MTCFRFMDWMHTNGSEISAWERSTHAQSRDLLQARRGAGMDDRIVQPARRSIRGSACRTWRTMTFIRHFADDGQGATRSVAKDLHRVLERGLERPVRAKSLCRRARCRSSGWDQRRRPWEAGWHFTALRSMQIFQIWEDVFGGHERFVRVLPTQSGNTGVSEGILGFRDAAKHADALAGSTVHAVQRRPRQASGLGRADEGLECRPVARLF